MPKKSILKITVLDNTDMQVMSDVYSMIVSDGAAERVFWDGTINSRGDFVSCMSNGDNIVYGIYDGDKWLAVAWINCFVGKTAQLHYCVFKDGYGHPEIGQTMVRFILGLQDDDGYCLDALVGITPLSNRLAVRYLKKSGFKIISDVYYVRHEYTGVFISIVTSICTRGGLYTWERVAQARA